MKLLLSLLVLAGELGLVAGAAPLSPVVKSWLAAQTHLQTWSADLTQTRTLQSLTQPLTATGHVWFAAPDRFRWELGQPPETIAIRTRTNLFIIYPRLKRVESISLTGPSTGPWRSALDMLQAGFPRSQAELLEHYDILSQNVTRQTCQLKLRPRAAAARRLLPQIEIDFDTQDYSLRGTELHFRDGSTMRNDFRDVVLNPKLGEARFSPAIPADYHVVHPLAGH